MQIPDGMGAIVRTAGVGRSAEELREGDDAGEQAAGEAGAVVHLGEEPGAGSSRLSHTQIDAASHALAHAVIGRRVHGAGKIP